MRHGLLSLFLVVFALANASGCKKKQEENVGSNEHVPNPPAATESTPASPVVPASSPSAHIAKLPGDGNAFVQGEPTQVGTLVWGGDMPAFYGNGGAQTREGTIYASYGLNIKFVPGDIFEEQLADYRAGKTPVLRGTFDMIGKHASRLCGENDDLCPTFVLIMTKSAGDHLVCRDRIKTLADLKGATLALQKNGPHEMFAFQLVTIDAKLLWRDVTIEWLPNLTFENSPPTLFAKNEKVDCAFAITPDMMAMTGGLTSTGTGADNTVKGAHVVASTAYRRESIKDMYAVSAKFARENPDWVRNFAAAYLKCVEEVKRLSNAYAGTGSPEFEGLLAFTTSKFSLPNDDESYGLYQDASFVGHAGNVSFFDPSNSVGFKNFSDMTNDFAIALGVTTVSVDMKGSPIDWSHSVFSGLGSRSVTAGPKLKIEATRAELQEMSEKGLVAGNTMLSFTATFPPDETTVDLAEYQGAFDEVIKASTRYTQAPVVIRGHVDTTVLVAEIIRAGMRRGEIKQNGVPGNFSYAFNGQLLDLMHIEPWLRMLEQPGYATDSKGNSLTDWVKQAEEKSRLRVETIKQGLLAYAKEKGTPLDDSRIHTEAVGVREPFVAKPRSDAEAQRNRRVEFSLVKISLEAATTNDFEL